jgi:hypothetical protein
MASFSRELAHCAWRQRQRRMGKMVATVAQQAETGENGA